ncbi:MAG: NAD(P)-dependent oxidoreductase [Chloroflexota bacterium]|nr:NAD(P)-dependent oxidoreductase [Chloroflexota bacterium]
MSEIVRRPAGTIAGGRITPPLTDETKGLVGADELDLLPDGAILINVGRAAIVDEEAFYNAIVAGKLRAAGSDVWYNYPDSRESRTNTPPSRFPFNELDNMVMSPHRGAAFGSPYTERMRMLHLAQLFNAANRGETIPNRVDLARGY